MAATDATVEEVKLFCADGDSIPDGTINLALADSKRYLAQYGVESTNEDYSIMHRLYTLHILYGFGFNLRLTAFSIGDHSQSFGDINMGDRTGDSPALIEFRKFAGGVFNFPVVT